MNKKIIISGWYGHGNVGDEAILQAMIDIFKKEYPDCQITVLSCNTEYTKKVQKVDAIGQFPYGLKNWLIQIFYNKKFFKVLKAIMGCDLFILGGGGFLSDWQPEVPHLWLRQLIFAKLFGKKTVLYRVGAGPFLTEKGKKTTKFYLNNFADEVIVRDKISYDWLTETAGVKKNKVSVKIDPVAEMDISNYKIENDGFISLVYTPHFDREIWGNQRYKWEELKKCFYKQIQTLIEKGEKVRLVFFQPSVERDLANELKFLFNNAEISFPADYKEAIGILAKSKALISLRLHGNIIAYALNKPFMPVIYHHKTKGFLDLIQYKPQDIILEIGEGLNWKDLPLISGEWEEKTKKFIELLNKNGVEAFYDKNINP